MIGKDLTSRILFIDYHGVLTDLTAECVTNPPHVLHIRPDSLVALRLLSGYCLYVISNQAGVAFGDYTRSELDASISKLLADLRGLAIYINAFFYCPHHPLAKVTMYRTPCKCRKPSPFFIREALASHRSNTVKSVLLGDNVETDIACAEAAGINSILITDEILNTAKFTNLVATSPSLLRAVPMIHRLLNGEG
jgi:D-glycero-D-manno-heptose 1,7-bisphosphate phosphatase